MGRQVVQLKIQRDHHDKMLESRRFDRLVQSEEFGDAWTVANDKEKGQAKNFICIEAFVTLQLWIRSILYDNFEKHTVKQLRDLASRHRIPYYSRMLHGDLIRALNMKGVTDDVIIKLIGRDAAGTSDSGSSSKADPVINR